ncbi:MAG: HEPN domain-containing protein, partial [Actinomycetota bacterium]|nr:HEPN domain-containing protein [Actinomycetota bacterium]
MNLDWSSDEEREEWMSQALLTFRVAEEMLLGDLPGECITNSFLAMIYAARAALVGREGEVTTWEEVISRFREAALENGLSPENRRALPVVAELYRRVFVAGDMEADPVTASACLDDARSFLEEVAGMMGFSVAE